MRPVIVGIDPGTTCAFAVLDFDLKMLCAKSRRNYSFSELILDVYEVGMPVLIGTDKKEVPSFIKEFSQKTGAKIITPRYDLKKGEKKTKVARFKMTGAVANVHEIDALASAIYAFEQYRLLIRKISSFLSEQGKPELKEDIITLLLDEEGLSIRKASELLQRQPVKIEKLQKRKAAPSESRRALTSEQKQILHLINQNIKLKQELQSLRASPEPTKKDSLDEVSRRLLSFKEKRILFLEKQMKKAKVSGQQLQKKISHLNSIMLMVPRSYLLPKLDNLGFEYLSNKAGLYCDMSRLYVRDISVFSNRSLELLSRTESIVFSVGKNRQLADRFALIDEKEIPLQHTDIFVLAERAGYDRALARHSKSKEKVVREIINEYKRERGLSD